MTWLSAIAALALAQAPDFEADFENALGTAGMTTSTARFDPNLVRMFGETSFTTPLFDSMFENPWRIPFFTEGLRTEFVGQTASDVMNTGLRTLGVGTRRTLIGDPLAANLEASQKPDALLNALEGFKAAGLIRSEIPRPGTVPSEVQRAAALVLNTVLTMVSYRRLAVRDLGQVETLYTGLATSANQELQGEAADRQRRIEQRFDLTAMGVAGHDVIRAAQAASELLAKVPPTVSYRYEIETTWGTIRLTGGSDDRHPDKATLLIIDTGGKDQYLNQPRNASSSNWTSIVIDSAGDDAYVSDAALANLEVAAWADRRTGGAAPGPGGALFGVVALIDTQGNDLYRSHRPAFGSARFGIASLVDGDGDDRYDAYRDSQGFAAFGAGLLLDLAGNDRYRIFAYGQGCGLTRGFGYLGDSAGNDQYLAETQIIDFPSPQDPKQNVSMAQGAATGRRADITDGQSLAGGVGWLYDARGDDQYTAAVFAQGVGYWQGVGILHDGEGKDAYEGQWYVQGAAAHYAIGFLKEDSGNDSYKAALNMALGAGHDFSVGMLLDQNGDDAYVAPNLSLGAGNANGLGVFVDVLGSDAYTATGLTLGKAAEAPPRTLRSRALTLGLFMDLFGVDRYPESSVHAGDARRASNWTQRNAKPHESQLGIFFDR